MGDQLHTLAFEIGMEEMPARFAGRALEALKGAAHRRLGNQDLAFQGVTVLGTPRRLILMVHGLAGRQPDAEEWTRGPSRKVAFDDKGRPTRAAEGFAKGQAVAVTDLVVRETEQGEYVFANKTRAGRPAREVLPAVLVDLIGDIPFPRPMRWGSAGVRFIRPVRWLLALLDEEVLPVAFGDVTASNQTYGHRTLAPGQHTVPAAADLPQVLAEAGVMADVAQRRDRIRRQVEEATTAAGGAARIDESLLEEVTHLVEYPTAFTGRFDPTYLDLPPGLLTMVMKVHQRYFPVVAAGEPADAGGGASGGSGKTAGGTAGDAGRGDAPRLLPFFIGVRNGNDKGLDEVRRGNERVLAARLADAKFFYDEDRQTPLDQFVPRLAGVMFRERLGTMLDKTRRLEVLVARLCDRLGVEAEGRDRALRAAFLAKADQVTRLVYELPELEGIMGREYARWAGEPAEVADALEEQYLPRPGEDALPRTTAGTLLAAADRADTLVGSFALGLEPTGSQDPFGLRRQAAALLILAAGRGLALPLEDLFAAALETYGDIEGAGPAADTVARLLEFCRTRLEGQMREADLTHDVVEAVLARPWTVIPHTWQRAHALTRLRREDPFEDVYTVFRRAHNLAGRADDREVVPALFTGASEGALHDAYLAVLPEARRHLEGGDYDAYFRTVARLRPALDRFLDEVLVMADAPELRANRLALLKRVAGLAGQAADLSRLVVG